MNEGFKRRMAPDRPQQGQYMPDPNAGSDEAARMGVDQGNAQQIMQTLMAVSQQMQIPPEMIDQFIDSPQFDMAMDYFDGGPTDMAVEMLQYQLGEFAKQNATLPGMDDRPMVPAKGNKGDAPNSGGYDFGAEFPGSDMAKGDPAGPTPNTAEPRQNNAPNKDQGRLPSFDPRANKQNWIKDFAE